MKGFLIILCAAGFTVNASYATSVSSDPMVCQSADVPFVPLTIQPARILRQNVPPSVFGFHLPWYEFQLGYYRNGKVLEQPMAWLKPFAGAVYRFPGGNEYDWQRTVAPYAQRKNVSAAYTVKGSAFPEFGLPEFVDFLYKVDGKAIVMLNLLGPDGKLLPEDAMLEHNVGLVNWFRYSSKLRCSSGKQCPILYWEMGNELDWGKLRWSAEQYLLRAQPLITRLKQVDPAISLAILGKTAPWDTPALSQQFNRTLAEQTGTQVAAVTLHPYYDGYPIPMMMDWLRKTVAPYKAKNSAAKVVITEHGRWPNQSSARWEDDWHWASGSSGAISTADFILSIMGMSEVDAVAWHALSTRGPWQLFHRDNRRNELYPSAVYWGLRVLRDAFLEDLIAITPGKVAGADYAAGYNLHVIAMKDKNGHISVLGVNRGKTAVQLSLQIDGDSSIVSQETKAIYRYVLADTKGSDNTDMRKNQFVMQQEIIMTDDSLPAGLCVPALSVFSLTK